MSHSLAAMLAEPEDHEVEALGMCASTTRRPKRGMHFCAGPQIRISTARAGSPVARATIWV